MANKFHVIIIICFAVLLTISQSHADGFVAEVLSFKVDEGYAEVKAGRFWSKPLHANVGDEFEVNVRVHNKVYDDVDVPL